MFTKEEADRNFNRQSDTEAVCGMAVDQKGSGKEDSPERGPLDTTQNTTQTIAQPETASGPDSIQIAPSMAKEVASQVITEVAPVKVKRELSPVAKKEGSAWCEFVAQVNE